MKVLSGRIPYSVLFSWSFQIRVVVLYPMCWHCITPQPSIIDFKGRHAQNHGNFFIQLRWLEYTSLSAVECVKGIWLLSECQSGISHRKSQNMRLITFYWKDNKANHTSDIFMLLGHQQKSWDLSVNQHHSKGHISVHRKKISFNFTKGSQNFIFVHGRSSWTNKTTNNNQRL